MFGETPGVAIVRGYRAGELQWLGRVQGDMPVVRSANGQMTIGIQHWCRVQPDGAASRTLRCHLGGQRIRRQRRDRGGVARGFSVSFQSVYVGVPICRIDRRVTSCDQVALQRSAVSVEGREAEKNCNRNWIGKQLLVTVD